MNNSFPRLIDGMVEALRTQILPHTDGDYARGQIFGVIFLLNNLRMRANWSVAFLGEQLDALDLLRADLVAIKTLPADAPRPPDGERPATPDDMVLTRDAGDGAASDLIAWLDTGPAGLAAGDAAAAYAAVDRYIRRQLKHEIATSAKPMFAEMSLGRETETREPA